MLDSYYICVMKQQKGLYKRYYSMLEDLPKIGRLKVISFHSKNKWGNVKLNCICDCGKEAIRHFSDLNKGNPNISCGCKHKEIVKEIGESNRQFTINTDKLVDNNKTSYIIGLLAADGYNSKGIGIALQNNDGYLLYEIAEYLEFNGIVKEQKRKPVNYKDITRLHISDKDYISFCEDRGICKNKTSNYTVPEYYKNSIDYWRGMIDGDGCIYYIYAKNSIYPKKYLSYGVTLVGTLSVIENFKSFCENIIGENISRKIYKNKKTKTNIYSLHITGKKALLILEALYKEKDKSFFMKRKYEKFLEIKDLIDKKLTTLSLF